MAPRFLNTSAINYCLEALIKNARERLIIISPFLRFNDRIRELLQDKDRLKIDVRIVYGKSELAPQEINWLQALPFIRTSFCQNLHAKCYLSEQYAIITSMNLYDFSQVNNNEMGVLIDRKKEPDLYRETYEEAQRLIRISEEVRLSAEKVQRTEEPEEEDDAAEKEYDKLTTSKLARSRGIRTADATAKLVARGLLKQEEGQLKLTETGRKAGGEFRVSKKYGPYFIWPKSIEI